MIALLLLFGLLLYIVLAVCGTVMIRRAFKMGRAKSIATIVSLTVATMIPAVDHVAGYLYFNHLCDAEPRVTVYRTVAGVQGLLQEGRDFSYFEKLGYDFIEYERAGRYYRITRDSAGKEREEEISSPTARYAVKAISGEPRRLNVRLWETKIVDGQTGEILGQHTTYSYSGGWVVQVIHKLGLSGSVMCADPEQSTKDFFPKILIPSQTKS
jgi:hypothetical protein